MAREMRERDPCNLRSCDAAQVPKKSRVGNCLVLHQLPLQSLYRTAGDVPSLCTGNRSAQDVLTEGARRETETHGLVTQKNFTVASVYLLVRPLPSFAAFSRAHKDVFVDIGIHETMWGILIKLRGLAR